MMTKNSTGLSNSIGDKSPELGKKGEKAVIIGETKKGLRGLRMAMIAGGAAAILGLSDPAMAQNMDEYEPLADTSGTMLVKKGGEGTTDVQEIKKIGEKSDLSPSAIQTLLSMAEQNKKLKDETGKEIMRVESVNNVLQLVNGGGNIPNINLYKTLTEDNYKQVVEELFDTSDINKWLVNSDGSQLSPQQKADYIEGMNIDKNGYLKKLDGFRTKFGDKAIADFLKIYNNGATKLPRQNREFLRRLLVTSSSIIFFKYSDDNTRTKYSAVSATQLGEYIILTTNGKTTIAKLQIGQTSADALKYLFPGKKVINDSQLGIEDNISEIGLRILTTKFDRDYKIVQLEQKSSQLEQKSSQLEQKILDEKNKQNQLDKSIEQSKNSIELNEKCEEISDKIENGVKKYINNPRDKTLEKEINGYITELRNIRKQAEKELTKENSKGITALTISMETTWITKFINLSQKKS